MDFFYIFFLFLFFLGMGIIAYYVNRFQDHSEMIQTQPRFKVLFDHQRPPLCAAQRKPHYRKHIKRLVYWAANGAGKSTLMRLLAGVDIPNKGTIERSGSISWPMGLASGMQLLMSGRENARFACRIQGVPSDQMDDRLAFIRKFSEIGKYFEMPVRTYSSGMRARLNFAIAMAFDFDFYIIDELTAVGDQAFRQKSRTVFEEKRKTCGFIKVSPQSGRA